jgi:hypothetical protein
MLIEKEEGEEETIELGLMEILLVIEREEGSV